MSDQRQRLCLLALHWRITAEDVSVIFCAIIVDGVVVLFVMTVQVVSVVV